ncbi:MAG: hypothetical protein K0V04_07180, partial [Deltaproteobacteria bacterium]|nr:hypothetical protein [Deltaproteobacteria bacterium]
MARQTRTCICVLCACTGWTPLAQAQPRASEAIPPSAVDPVVVTVTSPHPHGWPAAAQAIAFELDQAGYAIGDSTAPSRTSHGLTVERNPDGWQLNLIDHATD